MRPLHSSLVLALVVLASTALAPVCGGGFKTILLDAPRDGLLVDDPGAVVHGAARLGANFPFATVEVRVDGVDLIAALGLVAPFTGASGVVVIGTAPVMVSGFDFTSTSPRRIDVDLAGLPLGPHTFEVEGLPGSGIPLVRTADFELLDPMALALGGFLPGVHPAMPLPLAGGGTLANGSVADPSASAPIALSGGGSLRSGLVEAAEAAIAAGGSP